MSQLASPALDRFAFDEYLVRQKVFKIFGEAFHIYGPNEEVLFYTKLKAFKLKEDIRLYTGEDMKTEALVIQARSVIDFSAAYDVTDPIARERVGSLRRKGLKSIFKDEWVVLDEHGKEIGFVREDSTFKALARRSHELIAALMPQGYHVEVGGRSVAFFKQNFNPFVRKLRLDFSQDTDVALDRRLGIAAAVLICAIEGRQS